MLRAALERAIDGSYEIGRNEISTPQGIVTSHIYTADFSDKRNLRFYDRVYMPRLREIAGEAKARKMEPQLRDIFTPEGLYAVKLGRTARFSFNQLSRILFPRHSTERAELSPSADIIVFPSLKNG